MPIMGYINSRRATPSCTSLGEGIPAGGERAVSTEINFRAWIPAKKTGDEYHSDGKAKKFYQEVQYLQSFPRRIAPIQRTPAGA